MDVALIVVAAAFALVNGANTGGTMLSLNLTVHALRPVTGILVMTLGGDGDGERRHAEHVELRHQHQGELDPHQR